MPSGIFLYKKEGYDQSIPASGLIVYRINPKFSGGNVGYNGTTRLDEQYIFRPGGTTTPTKVEAPTGIMQIVNDQDQTANSPIYNMAGQRVNNSFKGLIIKGGKKFMKK